MVWEAVFMLVLLKIPIVNTLGQRVPTDEGACAAPSGSPRLGLLRCCQQLVPLAPDAVLRVEQ